MHYTYTTQTHKYVLHSVVSLCVRQVLAVHKNSLMVQLQGADDEALVLHLVVLLLFQQHTHCMLLAPGRCVSSIIYALQSKLPKVDKHTEY